MSYVFNPFTGNFDEITDLDTPNGEIVFGTGKGITSSPNLTATVSGSLVTVKPSDATAGVGRTIDIEGGLAGGSNEDGGSLNFKAGEATGVGDGGDITITGGTSSFGGNGGNVTISACLS